MKTLTDKDIVAGFLDGRSKEYSIVCEWIQEILRTQLLWDGSISSEDVQSSTVLKLLQNLRANRFEHRSPLKSYVQHIARFTLIDAIRRQRRVVALQQTDPPDESGDPHQLLERDEEQFIFERIVGLIDERCRELWTLIFDERLSYKEIARKLRISEGTVKARVYRCREEAISIRKKIT